MEINKSAGSHKNVWHGLGRQRIEIPKPILKSRILNNAWLKQLYICSLGYYPKAVGHYTYRKKGLPENFLFYCVDGCGWYKIGDKQYQVNTNEFFMLPRNEEHAYGSDEKHPWSIYWVHFGGDMLAFFNEMNVVKEHVKPMSIRNNSEVFALFSKIYKTLQNGYSTDNLIFANMCLSHFLTLFIYNSKHTVDVASDKTDCVESAIVYMKKHIDGNISLDELSKVNNYSTSRFSNLFKQKTGYAPIDYFIQMKMQKACQQLDFSDHSIKSIAYTLGFDDPYYFSRRFRKVIGMSPNKYRAIKKD
jgi:AraC family transcriptional regulator of arabinose operon